MTVEQRLEMACLQLEFFGHSATCIDPEDGLLTNLRTGELSPVQANALNRPVLQDWALTLAPKHSNGQDYHEEVTAKSSLDTEPS